MLGLAFSPLPPAGGRGAKGHFTLTIIIIFINSTFHFVHYSFYYSSAFTLIISCFPAFPCDASAHVLSYGVRGTEKAGRSVPWRSGFGLAGRPHFEDLYGLAW